jgi:hypothetical protein
MSYLRRNFGRKLGVMNGMKALVLAASAALLAWPVHAQTGRYDVKPMNFDLWCQEQANLPPDRCDKRLPEDDKAFEAYRAKIEKYEIPYLQRKDHDQQLDRTVLHPDPLDSPVHKDANRQGQTPNPQAVPQ